MNSVVLQHREHSVLVDPGVLPSELDDLARALASVAPASVTLIFTHGDWDHVLGRPWWPDAGTVAHDRFAGEITRKREDILRAASEAVASAGERWERGFQPFRPTDAVSGLHFSKLGPWRVVFRDAPGHSGSMLSIHLPEHRLLIAADMLSDIEIPLLEEPIGLYRRTLEELVPLAENGAIRTLIPGHGAVARNAEQVLERLGCDLRYLDELEHRVRAARARGLGLAETEAELGDMDYTGKDAAYSMVENHRHNVQIVYEGTAAPSSPEPSRTAGRGFSAAGR
jgi:glyoxylase-like metal-dependent hydrolase (beta-lactamase superfamily II)